MRCHIVTEQSDLEERIRVGGELVFDCRHKLDKLMAPLFDSGLPLILDLRDALFVDSSLLLMFLRVQLESREDSLRVVVKRGSDVHNALEQCSLGSLISVDVVA